MDVVEGLCKLDDGAGRCRPDFFTQSSKIRFRIRGRKLFCRILCGFFELVRAMGVIFLTRYLGVGASDERTFFGSSRSSFSPSLASTRRSKVSLRSLLSAHRMPSMDFAMPRSFPVARYRKLSRSSLFASKRETTFSSIVFEEMTIPTPVAFSNSSIGTWPTAGFEAIRNLNAAGYSLLVLEF